jgi:hypothetical protein
MIEVGETRLTESAFRLYLPKSITHCVKTVLVMPSVAAGHDPCTAPHCWVQV